MDQEPPKIVVAGDIALDWLQVDSPLREDDPLNWRKYPGYRWHQFPGGALLVAQMLVAAIDDPVHTYNLGDLMGSTSATVLHSLARVGTDPDRKDSTVLRVQQYLGYSGPADGTGVIPELNDDPEDATIVVLDDAGNGFRDQETAWPSIIRNSESRPFVVLKMGHPLAKGKLWDLLLNDHADRLIVVISANDLRTLGANISRRLSWERTVTDLAWQIAYNPALRPLTAVATLVIRIGIDGALVLRRTGEGSVATFLFDPQGYEDAYKDQGQYPGDMQGLTPAFIAALTRRLARDGEVGILDGVREGIIASRRLFRLGYGTDPHNPTYPGPELFTDPVPEDGMIERVDLDDLQALEDDPHWTILHHLEQTQFEDIARRIVREGVGALQRPVPIARFNNLVVVDRDEIESYQSIRNLLVEYINNTQIRRPLSFAVFGPPGSGKSFGVSELSKGLAPEQIESMTFNLSQFESTRDLVGAFHLIRDASLEGKIPLVFFDEFDARFGDQPLGWLRFFLAPMQDGIFKDGESSHPIGRAVFVFAGGTSISFDEFAKRVIDPDDPVLKDAKATDFISRLRGRIDIRGCNAGPDDEGRYLVRRALLLRSIIERTAKHLVTASGMVPIDSGVLRAFLKVPAYRHGVRSMQAIVEMSTLTDKKIFAPASIPPIEQLALHVDADLFRLLMLQDILFERMVEPMALAIHAEYLAHVTPGPAGQLPPMALPWETLPEEFRESTRDQAREIRQKLRMVNCGIMPKAMGVDRVVMAFTDTQVELLARTEHDRWMREMKRNGWVAGVVHDDERKVHPDLIPWRGLSDDVREKDRDVVRTIPQFLEEAGFAIYSIL
ncbi:RyR domain-containing protein [Methanosphaerula palustris]|uniref:Ryanodine receptor Ryr domain-containing protein n=1 Tax=Methanosphaerula palustris (strain ATCC BAA-1556 / DSM 19958 / E1-9c) TaxID=521011 RepID=B8GFI8_METPE|nr:RyR domain-containing protein [Methanosphaerula palustris]ACL16036.1 conserved hypothetical protein [Methanosphaerula palustris E1-9c]